MSTQKLTALAMASGLATLPFAYPAKVQAAGDNPLQLKPHHVAIVVADLDKEVDWYVRALGFKATDRFQPRPGFEIRFVDIPGYRIAIEYQKGSRRPPVVPRYFQQGYLHVVYEAADIDAVYKRLVKENVKAEVMRDPKTNAVYRLMVNDPEGNEVEIWGPGQ
jgi:catechol 2,3-dioxygenase-like lactoylglutathione lyase family enzyme